jgi:hypothetical protein
MIRKNPFFLLILSILAGTALAFPLWLDFPGYRNNPHDPQSPLWRPPTLTPLPPTKTFTNSPSATPTFSVSPPFTATSTATPTPSPTISPTPSISPFVYYDGDSAGAQMDGVARVTWVVTPAGVPGGTTFIFSSESSANGAHSGFFDDQVNIATLGQPSAAGVAMPPGQSVDVTAYQGLSLWLRAEDGCFDPSVIIHSPGTIDTGTSAAVTAAAYTVDGGAMDAGVWRHVVIPWAAFSGTNDYGNAYSLAGNANLIDAVGIQPSMPRDYFYYPSGPYWVFRAAAGSTYNNSNVDMDDVQFQALPPTALKSFAQVFDPFVSPSGITEWNSVWSTFSDSLACASPSSSFSFPAGGGTPVDYIVGPTNSCYVGHMSGTYGAAAGVGTGSCTASDYSFIGMKADLQLSGAPLNLTATGLALTAGHIKGLSFYLKLGPTSAAIDYDVIVRKANIAAINDAAHYRHLIKNNQLSSSNWTQFNIDFPAIGAAGTDTLNSFGQPAWANGAGATVNWDTTDCLTIQIIPDDAARGQNFDLLVGQIKFY